MEIPGKDMVVLRAFRSTQSVKLDPSVRLDPEQKQRDEPEPDIKPESNRGTPEPRNGPRLQPLIEFRIQQLHNRRFLLLKTQSFRKKNDDSDGTAEEMTGEDSAKLSELEAIQKELEELLVKKEELEKQGQSSNLSQQDVNRTFYTETPRGGVYLLPPPQQTEEDITLEEREVKTRPAAEGPTGPIIPVHRLGQTAALTQCPSCQEVVITETHGKVGEAVWMLCCVSSMLGFVAGCCVIPFFMDRLKDVHHQCPECQAHIHTHVPF